MQEGMFGVGDLGADNVVGDAGTEGVPSLAGRRFSIPEGTRELQVSNLNIDPSRSSPDWNVVGRLFAGMNVEINVIETDPDCFSIVCKPGRPVNLTFVENALTLLARQYPYMVVMRVA